jgi:hypothetical protein
MTARQVKALRNRSVIRSASLTGEKTSGHPVAAPLRPVGRLPRVAMKPLLAARADPDHGRQARPGVRAATRSRSLALCPSPTALVTRSPPEDPLGRFLEAPRSPAGARANPPGVNGDV